MNAHINWANLENSDIGKTAQKWFPSYPLKPILLKQRHTSATCSHKSKCLLIYSSSEAKISDDEIQFEC